MPNVILHPDLGLQVVARIEIGANHVGATDNDFSGLSRRKRYLFDILACERTNWCAETIWKNLEPHAGCNMSNQQTITGGDALVVGGCHCGLRKLRNGFGLGRAIQRGDFRLWRGRGESLE